MSQVNYSLIRIEHLSLRLKSSQLSELINNALRMALQKKDSFAVNILNDQEILITPQPSVTINIEDNKIKGILPLRISTNLKGPIKRVSVKAGILAHFEAEIERLDENNLGIHSDISAIEWTDEIDIQPPLLDFVLRDSFVKEMVENQLPAINIKINEALRDFLDFGNLLSQAELNRKIRIPLKNKQEMFLFVSPESIEVNKMGLDGDNLQFSCNISGRILPSENMDDTFPTVTPRVIFLDQPASGNELLIDIRLDLASLGEPVLDVVKSMPNIENAIGCNIEKVVVRPVGTDGVAIGLKLKGALNGGLSIAGRPVVDQNSLMLDIENLTFDFSGKNILSSLKGNIALSVAKSVIRKQFPIGLRPYIDSMIRATNDMISSFKLIDGLILQGNIGEWHLQEMDIVDGRLVIIFRTEVVTFLSPA
ncbi:MAG: DUF4403 family protein [Saprospiraceae bacterium]|jgi:hypothetical protein|nr:DUF4403 family protein [Candidatus Parvibacillus calidus]MBX2936745.1 DUF4403 family protein [Saprospiraceae bacterium]MBX7178462.1 DUF4403 family protein [Saprospiraceae bacterium]MCB0589996.1 DUF4403 family protein [Saprospiraceae bacterium]MCO5282766.1 DUF4403 family protein [Saprospiraceae bacterium]